MKSSTMRCRLSTLDLDQWLRVFAAAEVFVDADGGALAVGHAVDNQPRAKDAIAAGKDARRRGHQVFAIDGDQPAGRDLHAVFRAQEFEVGRLADGHDDGVAVELSLAAVVERRD